MTWLGPFKGVLRQRHSSSMVLSIASGKCLSTTSSSTLQSNDVELSYTLYPTTDESQDPSKTPLVFLHGLFGAKGNLHSVSKHLSASGRRIVTYDARNHGGSSHVDEMDYPSMSHDLGDLVSELNLSQPAVLGHSMGGKTAMCFALNYPDNLSSLIVADVSPQPSPGISHLVKYAEAMKRVALPQSGGVVKARKAAQMQLAQVIPDRMILSFLLTNLVEKEDGSVGWRMNLEAFLNNQQAVGAFPDTDTNGKTFNKPTLFLFGAESEHFKTADQGLIKSLFPNVQINAIPGAGHFVHAEKPVEFVEVVQKFLDTSSS